MARYEQYKDCDFGGIWQVPAHWEIVPLKSIFRFVRGLSITKANLQEEGIPVISYGQIHSKENSGYYLNEALYRFVSPDYLHGGQQSLVTENDFLFADTSEDLEGCGNCVFVDRMVDNLFAGYHTIVARPAQPNHNFKYISFLFMSQAWRTCLRKKVNGVKVFSVTQSILKQQPILLPPFNEQKAIAAYLDSEVSKIDEAIKQQQKMIELLNERRQIIISEAVTKGLNPDVKMKDSGIDWMGQINAEWRIFKLKYLIEKKLMYGANESAEDSNHAHPRYIRITDVNENGGLREETYRSLPPEKARPYLLSQGDILLARSGATAGKSFLFDLDIKACYAGYLIKATPNDKIAPRYLYYYTKSGIYECWCQGIHIQATIQNIGADKYANLPVPLPSLDEQNYIISYLDKKTEEVDKIVTASLDKIAILSKRKKIIINEVVTGKIKIG